MINWKNDAVDYRVDGKDLKSSLGFKVIDTNAKILKPFPKFV